MTKYTIFPKLVKVLEVYDDWQWSRKIKRVIGRRLIIGTYYVAEHDKTIGLDKGDAFIIVEKWDKYGK